MTTSNTADQIAALRRRIASNKGIAERAEGSAALLGNKAWRARQQIMLDQHMIEAMGGKVRR